jgi:hypothetical protein
MTMHVSRAPSSVPLDTILTVCVCMGALFGGDGGPSQFGEKTFSEFDHCLARTRCRAARSAFHRPIRTIQRLLGSGAISRPLYPLPCDELKAV